MEPYNPLIDGVRKDVLSPQEEAIVLHGESECKSSQQITDETESEPLSDEAEDDSKQNEDESGSTSKTRFNRDQLLDEARDLEHRGRVLEKKGLKTAAYELLYGAGCRLSCLQAERLHARK